jgi:hypothetical protein
VLYPRARRASHRARPRTQLSACDDNDDGSAGASHKVASYRTAHRNQTRKACQIIEPVPAIEWLLDSDPSIRWQVIRDLLDAPEAEWRAERAKVETEGWGARLLACQDKDGQWAGGSFVPADFDPREWRERGQPWTATCFSLTQLREFGLDPSSERARRTVGLIAGNSRWDEGRPTLLGGRGRGMHQRPNGRRRRLFRSRRLAHRRQADRRASGRRRLELRAG